MTPRALARSTGQALLAITRVRVRDRAFILTLAASYVIARTTGGQLPAMIFYTLLAVTATCFLWTRSLYHNLSIVHDCDRYRIQRGERVRVSLKVENEGFLPVPWMKVRDQTGGPPGALSLTTDLRTITSLVKQYYIESLPRGRYRPGPVIIEAGDPLGLFSTRRSDHGYRDLVVYPRVQKWTGLELPLKQPFGRFRTRDRSLQDPSSLAGVREFRTGDNPRHIDWKATARRGVLQTREFDLTATGGLLMVLDLYRRQDTRAAERAIEAAASLSAHALERGLDLSFLARGQVTYWLATGRGPGHLRSCLEILAAVRSDGKAPLHSVLARISTGTMGSTLSIVTSGVDRAAAGQILARLQKGPVVLILAGSSPAGGTARQLAAAGAVVYVVRDGGLPVREEGQGHAIVR